MEVEEWRESRYPGYAVSSFGRVRGATGRIMKGHPSKAMGYLQVSITANRSPSGKQLKAYVHDLVCWAFHGPRPDGKEVAHRDGSASNNRADNLAWKTHAENQKDIITHGTGRGRFGGPGAKK